MREMSRGEWHRRYMASLDDAGIGSKQGRAEWQAAHRFPESTRDWSVADYERAVALILAPFRRNFERLCEEHEIDPGAFVALVWRDDTWLRVRDYMAAADFLRTLPDVTDRILLAASRQPIGSDVE